MFSPIGAFVITTRSFVNVVTMQAPKTALPDMECKDKFLIQSTVVSSETTDADITVSTVSLGSLW